MSGNTNFSQQLEKSAAAGFVSNAEVTFLRNAIVDLSAISERDASNLIAINNGNQDDFAQWNLFYNETLTEHVICDREPMGYVTHENAEWLIGQIAENGIVTRLNNIELLLSVLEKGICVPAALSAFALSQIAHAIETGTGILRNAVEKGDIKRVTAQDAAWIKRILLAFGNFGKVAITREEAEVLFTINDLTIASANAPEWDELFNAAISNLILATSGYAVPERTLALHEGGYAQLNDEITNSLVEQLSRMLGNYKPAPQGEQNEVRNTSWVEEHDNRLVTHSEAAWLAERLARHAALHENERKIIAFLSSHAAALHPSIQELVDKQAA